MLTGITVVLSYSTCNKGDEMICENFVKNFYHPKAVLLFWYKCKSFLSSQFFVLPVGPFFGNNCPIFPEAIV